MMRFRIIIVTTAVMMLVAIAYAQQRDVWPPSMVENMIRPCSYSGNSPTVVATSAVSAATSSALNRGKYRLICTQAVYYRMRTTAPTAVTTDTYLPANTLEYIVSESDYFGAIRVSADGSCYLTQCR